ncbi:GSCOCG00008092001-RA-CDS [Cotesia congregata]|nr:GSCOCG00008092001-RA-CDS [Cotesia congregata]
MGEIYFLTVCGCKIGFCTLVRKFFHGSPSYTPTTPPRSPKKSLRTSLLYLTRQGIEGLKGVGPS